jgi:hypothetical protein
MDFFKINAAATTLSDVSTHLASIAVQPVDRFTLAHCVVCKKCGFWKDSNSVFQS